MPGERLAIPAAAYNAFLESTRYTRGKLPEADIEINQKVKALVSAAKIRLKPAMCCRGRTFP